MIPRAQCEDAVAAVRALPGVERVVVTTVDGIACVDDAVLEDRERAAASIAALLGVVELAAAGVGVRDPRGVVVYGAQVQMIARTVEERVLLVAVVANDSANAAVFTALNEAATSLSAVLKESSAALS